MLSVSPRVTGTPEDTVIDAPEPGPFVDSRGRQRIPDARPLPLGIKLDYSREMENVSIFFL